ncbi:hypothetical protein SK128_025585 [Halocaridina rubra]|uniref:Uncharacterized protein n=1 Tax=Halocaridina rubra TaxID=373956 RepID=A0AAN8ZY96_HALRR
MFEPNVTEFPAPESHVEFSYHSWDDPKLESTFRQLIDEHPFNRKIGILLPGLSESPKEIKKILVDDTDYYHISELPLSVFCTPVFLEAFLQSGKVYAISCDARLDLDNVAALTPDGWLILLLDKFSYQELQLDGKLSAHILRRPKERYVVKVNLKENFIPGKPYYKKVVRALSYVQLKFNFWISWVPNDAEVCPSSIAKYFDDEGYHVAVRRTSLSSSIILNAYVPVIEKETSDMDLYKAEDILEYIGCSSLGIKLTEEGTSVCDVLNPKPNRIMKSICTVRSVGFFIPSQSRELIQQIRSVLEETDEEVLPWAAVTVYGHIDSVVTWNLMENSYSVNGDNFYTILITRNQVWCYKVSGPRKPCRFFAKCNKRI